MTENKRKSIPKNVQLEVYKEAWGRCAVPACKETLSLEIGHIYPVSEGGDNDFMNLILLCPNCHARFDSTSQLRLSTIKKKAHELFDEASFLAHINNQDGYEQALETLDALMDDYDNNIPLIEILSASIERWEESAEEFSEFNKRINSLQVDHVVLKTLMEQYHLGVADFS